MISRIKIWYLVLIHTRRLIIHRSSLLEKGNSVHYSSLKGVVEEDLRSLLRSSMSIKQKNKHFYKIEQLHEQYNQVLEIIRINNDELLTKSITRRTKYVK